MNNFLVIGDTCMDVFVYGKCERLSPEAPIPIFTPTRTITSKGMAYNVYDNLLSIINAYSEKQNWVMMPLLPITNSTKTRYVDEASNHYFLRVDEGDTSPRFNPKDFKKTIKEANCIIISDYDKGFLSKEDILEICSLKNDAFVFLDTKKIIGEDILDAIDFVKFNNSEWEAHKKANLDCSKYAEKIIVTKGGEGSYYMGRTYQTERVVTMDVSGAGDTFLSALAFQYLQSLSMSNAIMFANDIANKVVQKRGVATI